MLENLISNWYIAVGVVVLLIVGIYTICKFAGLPTQSQISKIKKWLLLAVTEAEADLGSGTGQIKLRVVYDRFLSIPAFSTVAKLVPFELFSLWVDEALDEMEVLLKENEKVNELVNGK